MYLRFGICVNKFLVASCNVANGSFRMGVSEAVPSIEMILNVTIIVKSVSFHISQIK